MPGEAAAGQRTPGWWRGGRVGGITLRTLRAPPPLACVPRRLPRAPRCLLKAGPPHSRPGRRTKCTTRPGFSSPSPPAPTPFHLPGGATRASRLTWGPPPTRPSAWTLHTPQTLRRPCRQGSRRSSSSGLSAGAQQARRSRHAAPSGLQHLCRKRARAHRPPAQASPSTGRSSQGVQFPISLFSHAAGKRLQRWQPGQQGKRSHNAGDAAGHLGAHAERGGGGGGRHARRSAVPPKQGLPARQRGIRARRGGAGAEARRCGGGGGGG